MDGIIWVKKVQFLSNLRQVWSSKVYNINLSNVLQDLTMYVLTYVIYKSIVKIAHFLVIKLAHFEMRKKKYSVYGLDRKMVIKQIVDSCQRLLTILFFRRF